MLIELRPGFFVSANSVNIVDATRDPATILLHDGFTIEMPMKEAQRCLDIIGRNQGILSTNPVTQGVVRRGDITGNID